MAIAEHHPGELYGRNRGLLEMSHEQLHDFASTSEHGLPMQKTRDVDLGKKGGFTIKHPGALRRAAQREGVSTSEFEHEHEHDSGVSGRRARSALGLAAMRKGKRR